MKVFISWSGNKSQEVAKVLKHWIPCVIQNAEPYFSSADIDKGARWSTDIAKELQNASFGILCVTNENLSSAWLNFEAGALSKSIDQSKVCPFLLDLKPADIQDSPILQFQMANATKEDMFRLFKSINSNLGETKLDEEVLNTTFETFWPKIKEDLQKASSVEEPESTKKKNSNDKASAIDEILELVRYQYKLLKTPGELLPSEYLSDIIRANSGIASREAFFEIRDQVHSLSSLANRVLDEYNRDGSSDLFVDQLKALCERIHMFDMQLRTRFKRSSFFFE